MYAEERQQAIAELVVRRGRLSVHALAREYGVTTETVRRDLTVLERAGVLRRVHGGAVPAEALTVLERGLSDRDLASAVEKDRIAEVAASYLPSTGGTIVLDAGTTTARLAALLPADTNFLVVTNAVPIAARLAGLSRVELHLLPGRVRATTQAAVGEDTVAALGRLRADVVFVGANGVSLDHGLSTPDHSEAAAKRAMVAAGHRVVALADSTKFGRESTVRFAALGEIDVLVTDVGLAARDADALRARGIDVVRA